MANRQDLELSPRTLAKRGDGRADGARPTGHNRFMVPLVERSLAAVIAETRGKGETP